MNYKNFTALIALLSLCMLNACTSSSNNNTNTNTSTPSTNLHGVAATGAAVNGGTIDLKCASGNTSYSTTSLADGTYNIDVSGVPCVIRLTFGNPAQTLYSVATAAGVTDISPFTDLVFTALAQSAPDIAFSGFPGNAGAITPASLAAAIDLTQRRLNNLGVDVSTLDLLHQGFSPQNGDPYDDKLEALKTAQQNQSVTQASLEDDVAHNRDQPAPAPVQTPVLNMAEPGDGLVRLSWSPMQNGVSYDVHYDLVTTPAPGSSPPPPSFTISNASSPVDIPNLTDGSQYYFTVTAHNGNDSKNSGQLTAMPHVYGINFTTYSGFGSNSTHTHSAAYLRTTDSRDVYVGVYDTQHIIDVELDPANNTATPQNIDVSSGNAAIRLWAVAGGKGYLIAAGEQGTILYSTNGHSWSALHPSIANPGASSTLPESGVTYRSIVFANGKFVLSGKYTTSSGNFADILVTMSFNAEDAPSCSTACGSSAPYTYSSTLLSKSVSSNYGLPAVSYGNGRFIAVGDGSLAATNADDFANTALTDGSSFVYTSTDGFTWKMNTVSEKNKLPSFPARLVFGFGKFYALGQFNGDYFTSSDGLTWNDGGTVGFVGSNPQDIAVGPGQMISTDQEDDVFHTNNGSLWKSTNGTGGIPFSSGADNVVYGNGRYVAFGNAVFHSE